MCQMQQSKSTLPGSLVPAGRTIASAEQLPDLVACRREHDLLLLGACEPAVDHVISQFAACGSLLEANLVFCKVPNPTSRTWHAIILAHVTLGEYEQALNLYETMQHEGDTPCEFTLSSALKACGNIRALVQGRHIHDQITRIGLDFDIVLQGALIDMYARSGTLDEARKLFDLLPEKNLVTWGAMIGGYVQYGHAFSAIQLFQMMEQQGIKPDKVTILCTLKACGSENILIQGRALHEEVIRVGLMTDVFIGNAVVDMYAKCGSLEEALNVFKRLKSRNVVTYGIMIAGYTDHGHGLAALNLYHDMPHEGVAPNKVIYLCVLRACGITKDTDQGRLVHHLILGSAFERDLSIASGLIDMYAGCGILEEAGIIFQGLPQHDLVSWGALISGYSQHKQCCTSLELFRQMQQEGVKPDGVIFVCLLKVCGSMGALNQGKLIHHQIVENSFESDVIVGNSLVDMYAKCGVLEDAQRYLDHAPKVDVRTWNALIAGCMQHGHNLCALEFFQKMEQKGLVPDIITFSIMLAVCSSSGAIVQGRIMHDQLLRSGLEFDMVVGTSLVDMYAKSGRLLEAQKVFEGMADRDVVAWNALIAGYSQGGDCWKALQCFKDLCIQGLKPDAETYVNVLTACSHVGAVDEAYQCLITLDKQQGVKLKIDHLNSMIDILGRVGCLNEAKRLLSTMPSATDMVGWRSLLSTCRMYGNLDLGKQCFGEAVLLNPDSPAGYVLMSHIYRDAQICDDTHKLQEQCNAYRKPGRAWIELEHKIHEFTVGDRSHSENKRICERLHILRKQLKGEGFVALQLLDVIHSEQLMESTGYMLGLYRKQ